MISRVSIIARTLVVAAAALALLIVGLNQASAYDEAVSTGKSSAQTTPGDGDPIIQASERISIPYGFDSALRLANDGANVIASGEGACTGGETITIAFTVTQASTGASATGAWNGDCTGELQSWTKVATATAGANFAVGPAQTDAFAETRDAGDNVTDTQPWSPTVTLVTARLYLPLIARPAN